MNSGAENLEPFEKRIYKIFSLIAGFILFILSYFFLLSSVYLEFVPGMTISHEPKTLICTGIAALYMVYLIIFIIKGIKKNDSIDRKSLFFKDIQLIILNLFVYIIYYYEIPNKILSAVLAVLSVVSAVILTVYTNKDDKKNTVFFMIIITLLFGAFISAKILFTDILVSPWDFQTKIIVVQSKEPTKNLSRNIPYIVVPELVNEDNFIENYDFLDYDKIIENTSELENYCKELRESLNTDSRVNGNNKPALEETVDFIEKNLSAYDDEYFKDKCLYIKTAYFWAQIKDSDISHIVREWARNRLYFYSQTYYDETDHSISNDGYIYYLISLPKDKRKLLNTSDERFI